MKLFIKRDVSATDTRFVISDDLGREKYTVVRKSSKHSKKSGNTAGNILKLNILDENNSLVAKIRQLPLAGVNSFSLKTDDSAVTLVAVPSGTGVQCRFYGNNWHILGDVVSKNFSIIDVDNAEICSHTKRALYCELEITDSANEMICLLAALCVDMINTVDKPAIQVV